MTLEINKDEELKRVLKSIFDGYNNMVDAKIDGVLRKKTELEEEIIYDISNNYDMIRRVILNRTIDLNGLDELVSRLTFLGVMDLINGVNSYSTFSLVNSCSLFEVLELMDKEATDELSKIAFNLNNYCHKVTLLQLVKKANIDFSKFWKNQTLKGIISISYMLLNYFYDLERINLKIEVIQ